MNQSEFFDEQPLIREITAHQQFLPQGVNFLFILSVFFFLFSFLFAFLVILKAFFKKIIFENFLLFLSFFFLPLHISFPLSFFPSFFFF